MILRPLLQFAGWIGLMLAGALCELRAHEPGLSVAEIRLRPAAVEVRLVYAFGDVRRWLPPYALPAGVENSPELSRTALDAVRPLLRETWALRVGLEALAPTESGVELLAGDAVAFRYCYAPLAATPVLEARSLRLPSLTPTHRQLLRVFSADGRLCFETTLSLARPAVVVPREAFEAGSSVGASPSARDFFVLGVEHIWTGYDHLLFLFGLLVVARSFRSVLVIISCFTLAHSLTLAAATLGWVWLPPSFVEPVIAASIVFVGVENLALRGQEPRWRGALTFLFGLVHGFGFASVLRDLGVGSSGAGIAAPLVWFNLGVEAGQLGVAAITLSIMAYAFRTDSVRLRGGATASVLVSVAGLYWLVERTLG